MAGRFKINHAGIREVASSAEMAAEIGRVGSAVVSAASAASPTHQMKIEVLKVDRDRDGVVISVGSRWSFAHLIEWGSINNPPYAPLRRAVSSLGLKFEEE